VAYLRLGGGDSAPHWNGRGHFYAAAAEAMRRILIDNARRKHSQKRGGDRQRIDLADIATEAPAHEDLLALDEALAHLAAADPQAAQLVKLRHFAGLTVPQAAEILGVAPRTADFLWAYARAFLLRSLGGDSAGA
jgi:RNA polymerase sigma factor (TIGR02999 family)